MALIVKEPSGEFRTIAESVAVGVEVTQAARQLEVGGMILSRTNSGGIGVAAGFTSDDGGVDKPDGSIFTNPSYNPEDPFKGFRRTINMKNGNVGIGGSNDKEAMVPKERLVVVGNILVTGDVRLSGADCAEEFTIAETTDIEPGTVVIITEEGKLQQSSEAYDKKVAGVVSGGGNYRPGILLGRQKERLDKRLPIALVGKVFCKVDADPAPVKVGDLLTTSSTPGYAMKASEPGKAFGSVIGKALGSLDSGKGMIAILVALQ
jgi:hypothetical protein